MTLRSLKKRQTTALMCNQGSPSSSRQRLKLRLTQQQERLHGVYASATAAAAGLLSKTAMASIALAVSTVAFGGVASGQQPSFQQRSYQAAPAQAARAQAVPAVGRQLVPAQTMQFGSPGLRPVREVTAARNRANSLNAARASAATNAPSVVNETLRWRPSPDLKPQPVHVPQRDVFADGVPRTSHAGSSVQQAAWSEEARAILNQAINHGDADDHRGTVALADAKSDFFGNPFGDTVSQNTASQNSTSQNAGSATLGNPATGLRAPANQQFNDFSSRSMEHPAGTTNRVVADAVNRLSDQFDSAPADVGKPSNSLRGSATTLDHANPGLRRSHRQIALAANAKQSPSPTARTASVVAPVVVAPLSSDPIVQSPITQSPITQSPANDYGDLFGDTTPVAKQTLTVDDDANLFESLDGKATATDSARFSSPQFQTPTAQFEMPSPQLDQVDPPQELPAPTTEGSELRDLLQSVDPNASKADAPLPNPAEKAGSPSDRDDLFDNPFPKSANQTQSDKDDLDRLRDRINQNRDRRDSASDTDADEEDTSARTNAQVPDGLTCDEFRQRISRETIRTLSLDISAPFRPDVFDVQEYEELKEKFDSAQPVREWTSIDGNSIASGRLRDLAYEKAIIETNLGTRQELQISQLSEGDLAYISQNWGLPKECRLEQVAYTPRNWQRHVMTWKASNLCHKPLYFEEVNLERYGHTAGPILQPIVSSAHFFANIAVLPYKMGIHPPSECQYALGYYRPGNCAPWIVPPVPISLRGAVAQAAAVTTGFLLIP